MPKFFANPLIRYMTPPGVVWTEQWYVTRTRVESFLVERGHIGGVTRRV